MQLAACLGPPKPVVLHVVFQVLPNGHPGDLRITGTVLTAAQRACFERAFRALVLPRPPHAGPIAVSLEFS